MKMFRKALMIAAFAGAVMFVAAGCCGSGSCGKSDCPSGKACSGMSGATVYSKEQAEAAGKTACPAPAAK